MNLSQWRDKLDGDIVKSGDQYMARCPAHDDTERSLSLREKHDGTVLAYCHAGCSYREVVDALGGEGVVVDLSEWKGHKKIDPKAWWEDYTRIPGDKWEEWGVRFVDRASSEVSVPGVAFTWPIESRKVRIAGEKQFIWTPSHGSRPYLWPTCPEELPEVIYLTEGESDCGVLRLLDFEAYALTKGANGLHKLGQPFWGELKNRGVETIILMFDADKSGRSAAEKTATAIIDCGLEVLVADIGSFLDPIMGEKDLRDLYIKYGDATKEVIQEALKTISMRSDSFMPHIELIQASIPETSWLIKKVWVADTIGMVVGAPRVGKTWLALDACMSVASDRPFLGWFPVEKTGPVVYIPREDSLKSYQSRLQKILRAKGLGGSVITQPNSISAYFPPANSSDFPLFTDTSFSFSFTDREMSKLMRNLFWLERHHGPPSLLVFDPLLRMAAGIDLFRAEEVAETIFNRMDVIRREFECSIMLLHHRNKSGAGVLDFYGSIGLGAFSESSLYLDKKDGWVTVQSDFKGANIPDWRYKLADDLEDDWNIEVELDDKVADSL